MTAVNATSTVLLLILAAAAVGAETPADAFNRDPWPAVSDGPVKVFLT